MKQPELGKKIVELRKAKGLTQEELVERCNVSVRTLQRIETGDVMPRTYTVKTILAALDYDISNVVWEQPAVNEANESEDSERETGTSKTQKTGSNMVLGIAWISGLVYIILSFFEVAVEYSRLEEGTPGISPSLYILLKAILLAAMIFFQRGMMLIADRCNQYLLRIAAWMVIGAHTLISTFDIVTLHNTTFSREAGLISAALLFGAVYVVYGAALYKIRNQAGKAALIAAGFEIVSGLLFVTVVLALIGDIVHVPAELLEVIIIYRILHKDRG